MLHYALSAFRSHPAVNEIILVVAADDMERARELLATGPAQVTEKVVLGGTERRDSVWQALQQVSAGTDFVLIHDAARPFITHKTIDACLQAVARYGAVIVARPLSDTVKQATTEHCITATLPREQLWGAQTPQGFRTELLLKAYQRVMDEQIPVTDDAAVVERAGYRVQLVAGEAMNFKITHPEDLAIAERLLTSGVRVGFGYDVHRLVAQRALVLGGITIPHTYGLSGHSDADVLAHAIMDALLGAAALGDIGQHFPDTEQKYHGVSSLSLLSNVADLLENAGFLITHIDSTLAAEAPKLAAYIPAMRQQVAAALRLASERISIKATTTEGLGFVGTQEGIAAYATATITTRVPFQDGTSHIPQSGNSIL